MLDHHSSLRWHHMILVGKQALARSQQEGRDSHLPPLHFWRFLTMDRSFIFYARYSRTFGDHRAICG
jgi:hypothetical protein